MSRLLLPPITICAECHLALTKMPEFTVVASKPSTTVIPEGFKITVLATRSARGTRKAMSSGQQPNEKIFATASQGGQRALAAIAGRNR